MHSRFLRLILALALVLGMVSGCTPQPRPSPTPTSFATEEEAFAAAEETYRAYVDALNAVDLSDPETFEGVYAWTTGELNAEDRKTFTQMHADGWAVSGDSAAVLVEARSMGGTASAPSTTQLAVCVDVGGVSLVDRTGKSVVDADRTNLQSTSVILTPSNSSSTGWLISNILGRQGEPKCA